MRRRLVAGDPVLEVRGEDLVRLVRPIENFFRRVKGDVVVAMALYPHFLAKSRELLLNGTSERIGITVEIDGGGIAFIG